jgi:hypothetical protein
MKRRLFTILSALSLLLFVAVVVMWVRSYRHCDSIQWHRHAGWIADPPKMGFLQSTAGPSGATTDGRALISCAGLLQFRAWHQEYLPEKSIWPFPPAGFRAFTNSLERFPELRLNTEHWLGFGYREEPYGGTKCATVPHWSVALTSVVLPAWWIRSFYRRRRAQRLGHCSRCGYDLRATPERCPECGEPIPSAGVQRCA